MVVVGEGPTGRKDSIMKKLVLALTLAAALTGCKVQGQAPNPAPACEIVAPGADGEIDGQDFWAWRDVVSEDGELIYTGITRAKRWFSLVEAGSPAVLEQAVGRRVLRVSGLMERAG